MSHATVWFLSRRKRLGYGSRNQRTCEESSEDYELKCYLEDDCKSINIEPMGDGTSNYELSDSDHVLPSRDLENRKDVINRSVQVRISRFN